MGTQSTTVATPANGQDEAGALSTEKVTYRGYAKLNDKGEIDTLNAKAESANQQSWKKLEASGAVQWNENEFIRYIVHTEEGFSLLVKDPAQRVYIIQAGLSYIQNSKANGLMVERKEGDETSPAYNGETIDLREAINEPPTKRALTDQQKLERLVKSMGLNPDEMNSLFGELAKKFAAQSAPALPGDTEDQEEVVPTVG